jgi:hypothetical protein
MVTQRWKQILHATREQSSEPPIISPSDYLARIDHGKKKVHEI